MSEDHLESHWIRAYDAQAETVTHLRAVLERCYSFLAENEQHDPPPSRTSRLANLVETALDATKEKES